MFCGISLRKMTSINSYSLLKCLRWREVDQRLKIDDEIFHNHGREHRGFVIRFLKRWVLNMESILVPERKLDNVGTAFVS